jgi:hypothetical protein
MHVLISVAKKASSNKSQELLYLRTEQVTFYIVSSLKQNTTIPLSHSYTYPANQEDCGHMLRHGLLERGLTPSNEF